MNMRESDGSGRVRSVALNYLLEDLTLIDQNGEQIAKMSCVELMNSLFEYSKEDSELLYYSVALLYRQHFTWKSVFYQTANKILQNVECQSTEQSTEQSNRALQFLQTWQRSIPSDFENEERKMDWQRLIPQIKLANENTVPSTTISVRSTTEISRKRGVISSMRKLFSSMGDLKLSGTLLDYEPHHVALQITAHHQHLFSMVSSLEFSTLSWTRFPHQHNSPSLLRLIHWSDRLSWYFIHSILQPDRPKQRAAILQFCIRLATHFLNLRDYNALKCVVVAMGYSMVRRLRRTWRHLSKTERNEFKMLEEIVGEDRNWTRLRELETEGPCIPFLGLHLTDLVHLYETIPKSPPSGEHFEGWKRYAQKVKNLLAISNRFNVGQMTSKGAVMLIEDAVIFDEKELVKKSFQVEPKYSLKLRRAFSID